MLTNCIKVSKEKKIFISLILFRCAKRSIFSLKNEGILQKSTLSIQMETSRRNVSIFQTLISREFIIFWRIPIFINCGFKVVRKNKGVPQKYTISIQMENSRKNASILQALIPWKAISFWYIPCCPTVDLDSQKKEKNNTSQMRLRSVFKMRTSILNTETTEQMGCIIFFFFRLHEIYRSGFFSPNAAASIAGIIQQSG